VEMARQEAMWTFELLNSHTHAHIHTPMCSQHNAHTHTPLTIPHTHTHLSLFHTHTHTHIQLPIHNTTNNTHYLRDKCTNTWRHTYTHLHIIRDLLQPNVGSFPSQVCDILHMHKDHIQYT